MSTPSFRFLRYTLIAVAASTLTACASMPRNNSALNDAKATYERAAGDAQVVRSAPMELGKAQHALQQAEAALQADMDATTVEHYAYLAKQRSEVALQAGKISQADKAVADASQRRDAILIDARTREADAQRKQAEAARMETDAQRKQAETARIEAEKARTEAVAQRKLAEEQLAAAQASMAQAASASEHAKSLEEQLAQLQLQTQQTKRGMVLTLGDVLFDTGRAELNPGAGRTLDQLATFLKQNPERTVQIEGYTDAIGSDQLNLVLSERRAIAVKNALIDRGIELNRLSARGLGETSPVASNNTSAGRQLNRRVEILFPNSN